MMAIENPIFNLENLSLLKKKIELDEAGDVEFEQLQFFFSLIGTGSNFIFNELKSNGINSYEEYKLLSQKEPLKKEVRNFKYFVLGAMDVLYTRLSK